jgi:hypothetical protein
VTNTSAPTVLHRMSSTFFQWCTCIVGNAAGPRTSNPYGPTEHLRAELRAPYALSPAQRTVAEDDGEMRAPERRKERGVRAQRVRRVP